MASVIPIYNDYFTVEPTALAGTTKTLCYTVGDQGEDRFDLIGIRIVGAGAAMIYCKVDTNGTERLLNDDVTVDAGYPHDTEFFPLRMRTGGTISVEGVSGQIVWITGHKGHADSGGSTGR